MFGEILGFVGGLIGASQAADASNNATDAYRASSAEQAQVAREQFAEINKTRNKALAGTERLAENLEAAMKALGPFGGTYFNQAELAAEEARRYARYRDDADRAVTKAASMIQSDLIRAGMDGERTTLKADVAREFAPEAARMYGDAYNRARSEALNYISGLNTERYRGMDQMDTRRQRAFAEYDTVIGRPVQYQSALIGNPAVPGQLMASATGNAASVANQNAQFAAAAGQGLGRSIGQLGTAVSASDWFKNMFKETPKQPAQNNPATTAWGAMFDNGSWGPA